MDAASGGLTLLPVPGAGTEDVAIALTGPDEGCVFTGTDDGVIHRISHDGRRVDAVAHTGGRPLGVEVDPDGRLLVCDAHRGVLRVDPRDGGVETLASQVDGVAMKLVDNATIGNDGSVWFSDSSTQYGLEQWRDDLVQDTRTGRLLRLDPAGAVEVVIDGLAFANGVALSAAQDFVCVAETAARRVTRRWLSGPQAGVTDQLVSDLPGYPDNLSLGSDGLIWVALPGPTDPMVTRLQRGPMPLRRLATKVPERFQPNPKPSVRVQAYTEQGTLVHDVDVPPPAGAAGAAFTTVTGVREHDGTVWLGSLVSSAVARVSVARS